MKAESLAASQLREATGSEIGIEHLRRKKNQTSKQKHTYFQTLDWDIYIYVYIYIHTYVYIYIVCLSRFSAPGHPKMILFQTNQKQEKNSCFFPEVFTNV